MLNDLYYQVSAKFERPVSIIIFNFPEVVEDEEIEMYMEVFNLKTQEWKKEIVHGNIPKRCRGSFHAVSGNTLYLFGGYHEEFSNSLYALNLDTFEWRKLPDDPVHAPTPKFLGGMVALGNKLITLGGSGPKNHFTESRGATFLPNESFGNRGSGWNNALHEYNIDNGVCVCVCVCVCVYVCVCVMCVCSLK